MHSGKAPDESPDNQCVSLWTEILSHAPHKVSTISPKETITLALRPKISVLSHCRTNLHVGECGYNGNDDTTYLFEDWRDADNGTSPVCPILPEPCTQEDLATLTPCAMLCT